MRMPRRRILIVTAVEAERSAVLRGLGIKPERPDEALTADDPIVVQAGGVGMASSAASTTRSLVTAHLRGAPFAFAISAGIAGGFAGRAEIGATVLASRSVAADLGAQSPDGFRLLATLGLGPSIAEVDLDLLATLGKALPEAVVGEVLTVSTVTGTAEGAAALLVRRPEAVAEAMEGYAIASAAAQTGAAFAELRTISNSVGARDRESWRITEALGALTEAATALASLGP
jgi:futalosine hydrolase